MSVLSPDQSAAEQIEVAGLHVAIIMDGNGRWAAARGQPRSDGHRAGAAVVRRLVEAASDLGLGALSLYAFSSDNWKRPSAEVSVLMRLVRAYMQQEAERCRSAGVRVRVIGRRDRLDPALVRAIEHVERLTRAGRRLLLQIALDYSGRERILAAAAGAASMDEVGARLGPEVDLLIRTGGDQRLSDFLLWECAYAELLFVPQAWPDFGASDLAAALRWFRGRERRFGGLGAPAGAA